MVELSNVKGCVAIIPAAGFGKRFGGDCAKQYQLLNKQKVFRYYIKPFFEVY